MSCNTCGFMDFEIRLYYYYLLWTGEGLRSSGGVIADPIMAGEVKEDNLGVGAHKPGEVAPEDDIYEWCKRRMMLGCRH